MKKPWTRLLSAILTVVLLLQIAPLQAFAAADTGTADDGSGALLSGTETFQLPTWSHLFFMGISNPLPGGFPQFGG